MKLVCLMAAVAAVNAESALRGVDKELMLDPAFAGNNTMQDYWLKHGKLDSNHCEELWIPKSQLNSFWAAESWQYPKYTDGFCDSNKYQTYDGMQTDKDYADVVHVKRGVGAADDPVLTLTPCTGNTFTWTHGIPAKGSNVMIWGDGDLSSSVTNKGSYTVNADYGIVNLVNSGEIAQGTNYSQDIVVMFNNFGEITVSTFPVPATGEVQTKIKMPVPDISGTVTGTIRGVDQDDKVIFCTDMNLVLG